VTDTAASITSNVAVAASTIIAMTLLDWRLTLLSLGLLPFFILLTYRVGKIRRAVSTETQQTLAEMSAATEETLSVSGILLTKTFGQQESANLRFGSINARLAGLQIRQAMVGRWFFMIIGTIFSITPAFVYGWRATWGAGRSFGTDSRDDRGVHHAPEPALLPDGQLLNVQVEIQGSLALFDRIFEYLNMEPEIRDRPDAVPLDPARVAGRVAFRDVSFRYPASPVLATAGADGRAGADGTDSGAGAGSVAEERATVIGEVIAETEPSAEPVDVAVADLEARPDAIDDRSMEPLAIPLSSEEARAEQRPGFALEGIDFDVEPGMLVALVGPSGSGRRPRPT
jgi:ATP-binding cassette subfamily B protein